MSGRPRGALPQAGSARSSRFRSIAVSFLIVVGGTIVGAALGFGGALFVFSVAEGEARGGLFVVAGFLMIAGAGLGLVAGAVCAALWLRKRLPNA